MVRAFLQDENFQWKIILAFLAVPFLAFALFILLSAFSQTSLLVGWDTPFYLYSVKVLKAEGIQSFLGLWGYHNFVYSLMLYPFYAALPTSLFTIAKVLPILLALATMFLVGWLLSQWFKDGTLAVLGVIFSCIWIAPYILASNLFSQLLSLVLGLVWLGYAFRPQTGRLEVLLYLIFLLASISHVYTMLFLYIAFVLSNLVIRIVSTGTEANYETGKHLMVRSIILGGFLAIPLIVSTVMSGSTLIFGPLLNSALQEVEGSGVRQVSSSLLFISFGANLIFVVPLALLIVLQSMTKSSDIEEKTKCLFIACWTLFALTLPLAVYILPHVISFAERMIIITPIPILLALFTRRLSSILNNFITNAKIQRPKLRLAVNSNWPKRIIVSIMVVSIFLANVGPLIDGGRTYLVSFVPSDLDTKLRLLNQNVQFSEKPIFILDASDASIADYGELWDNTIGAYIGPHYTYFGSMENLANFRCTFFGSPRSDLLSETSFKQLNESKVLSYDGLITRPIVLLDDFYKLKEFEMQYANGIGDGSYLVNFDKLWADRSQLAAKIEINAFFDSAERIGPWYGINRQWSNSSYVLELYSNVSGDELVSYKFYVYDNSTFSLKVHYFDFSGYTIPLELHLDGGSIGFIQYAGLQTPQTMELSGLALVSGWHTLSVGPSSKGPLMVDLDYFLLERNSF